VLRPEAWLMIGHCGGLRPTQKIGDFVLAHAYLRDDHVLDDVLPPEIPLPAIAEVQQALAAAAEEVSGAQGSDLKQRMRTGTVVTTDDRNWELRYSKTALRLSQSRAVAIEMESATVAAQGYRFRVPYGTLLCVSDKPLHGERTGDRRPSPDRHSRLRTPARGGAAIALTQAPGVQRTPVQVSTRHGPRAKTTELLSAVLTP
jgi:AMP nucleosidase